MSTDERVATDIIETLKDGHKGYNQAADTLENEASAEVVAKLRQFAAERGEFASELERMAAIYGDDIDEDGSMAATLHRGWISLKDALTGSDPSAVLAACQTGDEHAVTEYEKALAKDDVSPNLRQVLTRQLASVRSACSSVATLAD